jgi:hypothetical protein
MRIAILLLAFATLSAFAAEDPKYEKARKTCEARGDAKVAAAKVKSPIEVVKIKNDEVAKCLREAGMASGPIRAK